LPRLDQHDDVNVMPPFGTREHNVQETSPIRGKVTSNAPPVPLNSRDSTEAGLQFFQSQDNAQQTCQDRSLPTVGRTQSWESDENGPVWKRAKVAAIQILPTPLRGKRLLPTSSPRPPATGTLTRGTSACSSTDPLVPTSTGLEEPQTPPSKKSRPDQPAEPSAGPQTFDLTAMDSSSEDEFLLDPPTVWGGQHD
jgi:hypothetical protein